jgi:tRNA G18 (ribose-2'-O)-methylase SpoU
MTLQRVGLAHPRVRHLLALVRNAVPNPHNLFVVEGAWAHERLLAAGVPVEMFLWCPEAARTDRAQACGARMRAAAAAAYEVSAKVLTRLSSREKPDGLLSLARLPTWDATTLEFGESALVLVADGIEYAGNLGTLIRTADACRADCLVLANRRVRLTHPRVFGASRGTVLTTPVVEFESSADAAGWLDKHGFEIFLADPQASRTYRTCTFRGAPTAVVVGSEGRGPSPVWYDRDATTVSIPMLGVADSLNVSASAAILMFEARARKAGW